MFVAYSLEFTLLGHLSEPHEHIRTRYSIVFENDETVIDRIIAVFSANIADFNSYENNQLVVGFVISSLRIM